MSGDPPRYRHSPHVDASKVAERLVLYHREFRKALVLNPTGSVLWELLTQSQIKQTLTAQLRSKFPSVKEEQAVSDVSAFLADLLQHGMLVEEK